MIGERFQEYVIPKSWRMRRSLRRQRRRRASGFTELVFSREAADSKTTGDGSWEYEVPKSRRGRRRERRERRWAKWRVGLREFFVTALTEFVFPRRTADFKATRDGLREHGAPKSRRERRQERQGRRWRRWRGGVREFLVTILVAFVVVFGFVRPFVVEAYRIPSESMVPTLEVGDRVLANKFIYHFSEPERGDIVVFDSIEGEDETLIKRVVGVAGDKVRVRQDGVLFLNGEQQEESYLNERISIGELYRTTRVPPGHVFLLGDNRGNSADSRVFGPVPLENIQGEAFFRFWPILKIGPLSSG